VTITKPDAREGGYKNYFYTKNKITPRKLTVPLEPGDYEIRYVFVGKSGESKGSGHKVLARQALTVTAVTASVSAPKTAKVGRSITVEWEGPKSSGDFVTITAPDARDKAYKSYAYTKNGSPSKLTMPLIPGDYEIRFVQDGRKILARQPITIEDITMTLKAPKKAKAGETIEVNWDGPVAKGDWVTVIAPDAIETKYKSYFYPINGAPGKVTVPKEPGDYEVRYVMRGKRVIAREAITVTE
jgi:Ca-activated chloride channel family protein